MKVSQNLAQDSRVMVSLAKVLPVRARLLVASVQQPWYCQLVLTTGFLDGPVGVAVGEDVVVVVVVVEGLTGETGVVVLPGVPGVVVGVVGRVVVVVEALPPF